MKKTIIAIILGVLFCTILISYSDPVFRNQSPIAEKGVIDLSSWDFEKDGAVRLNGEWECYNEKLLIPEDFKGNTNQLPQFTEYRDITSNIFYNNGEKRVRFKGVRTFRLIVKTDKEAQFYGIRINNTDMSNRLYVNGNRLGSSGTPAKKGDGYKPSTAVYDAFFSNDSEQIEIILQVANYDYPFLTKPYNIVLGYQKDIQLHTTITLAIELCGAALCFIIALYYVYLHYAGNKGKDTCFALLEFIMFSILFVFVGNKFIFQLFPWLSFEIFVKIQNICLVGVPYSIAGFSNIVRKEVLSNKAFKTIQTIFFFYLLAVLFLPYRIYVYLINIILIFILLVYLFLMFRLCLLGIRYNSKVLNKFNIVPNAVCLACVFIGYFNNILYTFGFVSNKAIGSIAIGLFIILSQVFLAFQFIANYNKMIQMEKIKDEFFIKSSYVLNAPLNSISSLSNSIIHERTDSNKFKEIVLNHAQMIQNIAEKLLGIVNVTLDVTQLQNNQLKLSEMLVDMKICAELVVEEIKELDTNGNINIVIDVQESLLVSADEGRVRQILHNLLQNALYSMSQGTIKIKGTTRGKMVYVSVEDNGCGISDEIREEIFKPYTTFLSDGIGLGLYISRQLAEHMGGKLFLEWTETGKGSCFIFSLPLGEMVSPEQMNRRSPIKKGTQYVSSFNHILIDKNQPETILIVDDEMFNVQTAFDILTGEGYNVVSAYSGEEAIECIETIQVDLVILDIMMPASSGITTCKKIRERYTIIEMPVLLSTAVSINNDLNLGLIAQANDFITKPFIEKELIARVKTLIALKTSIEDASKSELAFLQAQIKPHFIYNAINTIISFCYTDSEKAATLLTNFSKYLRQILDIDNRNMFVPLYKEIEMIKAFVEIQNARFGDRFMVDYQIDPLLIDKQIPCLIIQPLVENAIKHGLYGKAGQGFVNVIAQQENEILTIMVKDSGVGMSKVKVKQMNEMDYKGEGVGLWNIKKRIRRMKGAAMEIYSMEGQGTTVIISIKT